MSLLESRGKIHRKMYFQELIFNKGLGQRIDRHKEIYRKSNLLRGSQYEVNKRRQVEL